MDKVTYYLPDKTSKTMLKAKHASGTIEAYDLVKYCMGDELQLDLVFSHVYRTPNDISYRYEFTFESRRVNKWDEAVIAFMFISEKLK